MIALFLFLGFLVFIVVSLIIHIVRFIVSAIIKKSWIGFFDGLSKWFFSKGIIIPLIISAVIFILGSIIPYLAQQSDNYLISYYTRNITLYQQYISDYTEAAQRQINEYQKMQSEMARSATALQLQFWSQQVDVVGNKLTDTIKSFNDKILEQQILINEAKSRIELRPENKWYFWID